MSGISKIVISIISIRIIRTLTRTFLIRIIISTSIIRTTRAVTGTFIIRIIKILIKIFIN